MFKIVLAKGDVYVDMPKDLNLSFEEACWRADLYKRHNNDAIFSVVSNSTGKVVYKV